MLIVEETEISKVAIIKDEHDNVIHRVHSYDTETKETLIYKTLTQPIGRVIKLKQHFFPGSKAYNKLTGEEIK